MPKDGDFDLAAVGKTLDEVKTGFEAFKEKNDEALKELASKGHVDTVLQEHVDRINDDLQKKQDILDQAVAAMKRKSLKSTDDDGKDLDQKAFDWAQMNAKRQGSMVSEYTAENLDEYKKAFQKFLRKGEEIAGPDEKKALSVGSDPDGGFVVHPDMNGRIVSFVYETSPVRQYAASQTIGTDALEGLHDLDEAAAGWVEETQSRTDTGTPQFKAWRIPVHEVYAFPKATQKLLDDGVVNIEAWLAAKIADKFARMENAAFVNGDGVGKPRGFLTYPDWASAGTFEHGKIEQFDTGGAGAFVAAPNGGDVLINALYALKAPYRANATWAMNRTTMAMTRKLKDSDGAYLWAPGIQAGQPSQILGYPVASFEDMPNGTTDDALAIAVADWREAYQIVDRMGVRVLRDPYTAKPYVGFYATKRTGGDVLNFEAIKLIKFAD